MADIHHTQRVALEYIRNAGGAPEIEWFDDDHEPIGRQLRSELRKLGLVQEHHVGDEQLGNSTITLTEAGARALAEQQKG